MSNRKYPFLENTYYHVFNRGVDKRIIYLDSRDYTVFCDILLYYLTYSKKQFFFALKRTGDINLGLFMGQIKLISYSLMPNHFHLLLYQADNNVISDFMKRVLTTYVMYFNLRYKRVGSLFQGRFKAKSIDTDEYLLQVNKYIHRNAISVAKNTRSDLVSYPWSSYGKFLGAQNRYPELITAVDTTPILDYFKTKNQTLSYRDFVEEMSQDPDLKKEIEAF